MPPKVKEEEDLRLKLTRAIFSPDNFFSDERLWLLCLQLARNKGFPAKETLAEIQILQSILGSSIYQGNLLIDKYSPAIELFIDGLFAHSYGKLTTTNAVVIPAKPLSAGAFVAEAAIRAAVVHLATGEIIDKVAGIDFDLPLYSGMTTVYINSSRISVGKSLIDRAVATINEMARTDQLQYNPLACIDCPVNLKRDCKIGIATYQGLM